MTPIHLVLLPGMDGTGILFEPLLAVLPTAVRPIVVRYPSDEPLDYAALLRRVLAALPRHGEVVVLGESFSGPLAFLQARPTEAWTAIESFLGEEHA